MQIDVEEVSKDFGARRVLDHVALAIKDGEFLGLLGPSGSGKTTLLRILAGLETPDKGRVLLDGEDLATLPLETRRIGFVFQHYALFDHMSVFDNVAFGLKAKPRAARKSPAEIGERVRELLALVQLDDYGERFPEQLSGGQRQRVALARTLAIDPKVLLLDEPFGALDAKVRVDLRRSLREIHDTAGLTTIFVTHDQEEALDLADRVALINAGAIEQIGTPVEIYDAPRSPFVFDFLGHTNSFPCTIAKGKAIIGTSEIALADPVDDGPGVAFVRPSNVMLLSSTGDSTPPNAEQWAVLPGQAIVRFISAIGERAAIELIHDKRMITSEMSRDSLAKLGVRTGTRWQIRLRRPRVYPRHEAEQQTRIVKRQSTRGRLHRRLGRALRWPPAS